MAKKNIGQGVTSRGKRLRRRSLWVSGFITFIFLYINLFEPTFVKHTLDLLERKTLDVRFFLRMLHRPVSPLPQITLITVDEKSIRELGRWPWPRTEVAKLVRTLAQGHPKVIGMDILFTEPQVSESLEVIRELKKSIDGAPTKEKSFLEALNVQERKRAPDRQLAEAIEAAGNVILPFALMVPAEYEIPSGVGERSDDSLERAVIHSTGEVPEFLVSSSFGLVKKLSTARVFKPIEAEAALLPLDLFARRANALGNVYYQPDRDGVLRWEYLTLEYRGDFYPSFGLQIAREALGVPRENMKLLLGEGIELGNIRVPTDERGRMLINYLGRERTFSSVSATDVIHQRIPSETFKDRILLVGATALGTYDLKVTPLSANMAGVEKNATVIQNILKEEFLRRTETMKLLDSFFILLFGLGLGLAVPRLGALPGALMAAGLLLGYVVFSQFLFEGKGLWINLLYPSAVLVLSYSSLTVLRFMTEEQQGQQIRKMFSSYLSPKMVAELVKDPEKAKLGGQRKTLTVLFSDIRGFTSFSERHQPEAVVAVLNEYMKAMAEVIFRWEGTLDKFVGDAIMVFWGAPINQPNHAELAIRCALHMQKRLGELQESWKARGGTVLEAGIGINTGEMVVGNIGAEGKKMDYTVIGDHVNLGARIESLTREYQAHILITESTYQEVKQLVEVQERFPDERRKQSDAIRHPDRRKKGMKIGHAEFRDLEAVKVKGKEKPVRVYEVFGLREMIR